MKQKLIYNFLEYFLLTSIIALTGFEFFYRDNIILYFVVGPISLFFFFNKKNKVSVQLIIFLALLFILFVLQSYMFNMSYSFAIVGVARFIIYFLVISVIGQHFNKIFVNILYIICLYSVILYLLTLGSPVFYDLLIKISKHIVSININDDFINSTTNPSQNIILYVIPLVKKLQNNGPFLEPGMFAVFINIALAINIIMKRRINDIKNIIFLIASITTLSTTSFIATFVIYLYHYFFVKRNIYTVLFLIMLPFIVVPVYNSQYIIGKIESNYQTMDESYSRFGAIIFHFKQIEESPLIGYGSFVNESLEKLYGEIMVSPNGITNIMRIFGIPMSLFFYILLFKTAQIITKTRQNNKGDAILLFMIFLIVAFSQDVTTRHFYYMLYMLPLVKFKTILINLQLKK